MSVDALAIGPHPDDADLGVGATLCKLAKRGYRTAILDLTRGELGTRGTPEERAIEAAEAGSILGVAQRLNAALPDGGLDNSPGQREVLIRILRQLRPQMLFVPSTPDRHPDHEAARALCRAANFYAGVQKIAPDVPAWRAPVVYYYGPYQDPPEQPAVIIDVSESFETKMTALAAFRSQFYNPDYEAEATAVSSRQFWENIETRARYWGNRAGVQYGEALYSENPLALDIPPGLA